MCIESCSQGHGDTCTEGQTLDIDLRCHLTSGHHDDNGGLKSQSGARLSFHFTYAGAGPVVFTRQGQIGLDALFGLLFKDTSM